MFKNEDGDKHLALLYQTKALTEEEWNDILPEIYYREFNEDFEKLRDIVDPLFGKIFRYHKDLYLEIWQGIFSNGAMNVELNDDGETYVIQRYLKGYLKDWINRPENGELYCKTLLEIYPYLREFLKKYPHEQYTFFRFYNEDCL
jgi:hypothetical protein